MKKLQPLLKKLHAHSNTPIIDESKFKNDMLEIIEPLSRGDEDARVCHIAIFKHIFEHQIFFNPSDFPVYGTIANRGASELSSIKRLRKQKLHTSAQEQMHTIIADPTICLTVINKYCETHDI